MVDLRGLADSEVLTFTCGPPCRGPRTFLKLRVETETDLVDFKDLKGLAMSETFIFICDKPARMSALPHSFRSRYRLEIDLPLMCSFDSKLTTGLSELLNFFEFKKRFSQLLFTRLFTFLGLRRHCVGAKFKLLKSLLRERFRNGMLTHCKVQTFILLL